MNWSFYVFWYPVYIFGLTIVICFFLFLWMLKKLSLRFGFEYHFITNSILWYFLSVFLFSRIFYIISMWKDMRYIKDPLDFFIMADYNFSLFWALFGFLWILFLNTKLFKKSIHKYIDWIILSFLFIAIIWYIGAFFWGQTYGVITNFGFEITSNYGNNPWKLFPLALVYSWICFLLFSGLYILSLYVKTRGIIGYVGLGIFSAFILWLEFFSGKPDIFKATLNMNLSQISAIICIILAFSGLFRVMTSSKSAQTILSKANH